MKQLPLFLALILSLGSCTTTNLGSDGSKDGKAVSQDDPILLPGVYVEKNGTMAKVTFIYENPDAMTVGLAGGFQNWNPKGAYPLKKDASGMWRISISARTDAVILYKFVVDGRWTEDPNAPERVGDGYDGNNGRVDIENLLKK